MTAGLITVGPNSVLAYCLDDLNIGMFTEREFTELEAPPRAKTQDKRLNALLKRGMQATGANLISVDGVSKKQALAAAAEQQLSVLAYLELEAVSQQGAMPGPILDISSSSTLQLLAVDDGKILGEGSDIGLVSGVNIENALPEILTVKTVEILAGQAEKAACSKGLPSAEAVVAEAKSVPKAVQTNAAERTLIADIQHALIAAGYDIGLPDGVMGHRTNEAIKQAEMKLKMPPTGKPSPLLLHKLPALDPSLIGKVQEALYELGRLEARPSRVLDGDTKDAIEAAEFDFDLTPADGLPDRDLLRVLRSKLPMDSDIEAKVDAGELGQVGNEGNAGLRKRIEELLVQLDYFDGPASGIETIDSERAIWEAERDLGLDADGMPDKKLWRLLTTKAGG